MYLQVIAVLFMQNCMGQEQVRMTLVSLNHFQSEDDSEYQCHLSNPDFSDNDIRVDSLRIQSTRPNGRNPAPQGSMYQQSDDYPHYKIEMINNNDNDAFGVFGCKASKNGVQETVISTTRMRSDADIVPSNELFTQTVNIGDSGVTISMRSPTGRNVRDFIWRKNDGNKMNSGEAVFSINTIVMNDDAGVYHCHIDGERNKAKTGLNLLIVRACPAYRWGPTACNGVCDSCYNGGVCDENNGKCVCPPGFKGDNCLQACGGNTFGHTCEKKCLSNGDADSCRDKLFCLVRPFGCRCNTGWKGLACDTACDANTFGASCLQSCHCASNQCDRYTGRCTGTPTGCKSGWTGDNCQELPIMHAAPMTKDVSNTSITIRWRAWDPNIDDGDPPVVAYIPYYRQNSSTEWTSGGMIIPGESLVFRADNLEVDTLYDFSVAVVREGKNGEEPGCSSLTVKTFCNVPNLATSVNVKLTPSNRVNVSWQLSPGEIMCSTGVTSFNVYYKIEGSIDDSPRLAGTVDDVDRRWFIVDEGLLQPGTSYSFFITVTTDQESDLSESNVIESPANIPNAPVYLLTLIIIPVMVIAVIVVCLIVRSRRKQNFKDKKTTRADDGYAAVADDPEDYIPLEKQSKTISSSKYEDLNNKLQSSQSILPQYDVTIVPERQRPVAPPRTRTRNMKGINSGANEDVGVSSENRQLPDVPQSDPSGDKDEDNSYEVPDGLEEYTGVCVNVKNKNKLKQPEPIKVAEFEKFMGRNKEDVVRDIVHQFMSLPSGGQYPWSVAVKFQNKPRNFFKTILP